jgi:NDP-sugar pyrophosphorylase family protein
MSVLSFAPADFLDLTQTEHAALFEGVTNAWEVLPKLAPYLAANLRPENRGRLIGHPTIGDRVFIGEGTVIEPGAYIKGPAWIGANCEIRHGAYLRENVIVGAGSVIGNSSEIKNSLLFAKCQVPHFNYVGDSVLGTRVHLAAGVIASNLKLDGTAIDVRAAGGVVSTGLRKFGALIGDGAEVGCQTVLNPGTVIGRRALIYPGISWRGVLKEGFIARSAEHVFERRG